MLGHNWVCMCMGRAWIGSLVENWCINVCTRSTHLHSEMILLSANGSHGEYVFKQRIQSNSTLHLKDTGSCSSIAAFWNIWSFILTSLFSVPKLALRLPLIPRRAGLIQCWMLLKNLTVTKIPFMNFLLASREQKKDTDQFLFFFFLPEDYAKSNLAVLVWGMGRGRNQFSFTWKLFPPFSHLGYLAAKAFYFYIFCSKGNPLSIFYSN